METQSEVTPGRAPNPWPELPVGSGNQPASANQVCFGGPILPGQYVRDEAGHLVEVKPPRPCPDLLTQDEAAEFLRLDVKNAGDTLRYYRQRYGLRVVQISRNILYPREELDALWHRLMAANPR